MFKFVFKITLVFTLLLGWSTKLALAQNEQAKPANADSIEKGELNIGTGLFSDIVKLKLSNGKLEIDEVHWKERFDANESLKRVDSYSIPDRFKALAAHFQRIKIPFINWGKSGYTNNDPYHLIDFDRENIHATLSVSSDSFDLLLIEVSPPFRKLSFQLFPDKSFSLQITGNNTWFTLRQFANDRVDLIVEDHGMPRLYSASSFEGVISLCPRNVRKRIKTYSKEFGFGLPEIDQWKQKNEGQSSLKIPNFQRLSTIRPGVFGDLENPALDLFCFQWQRNGASFDSRLWASCVDSVKDHESEKSLNQQQKRFVRLCSLVFQSIATRSGGGSSGGQQQDGGYIIDRHSRTGAYRVRVDAGAAICQFKSWKAPARSLNCITNLENVVNITTSGKEHQFDFHQRLDGSVTIAFLSHQDSFILHGNNLAEIVRQLPPDQMKHFECLAARFGVELPLFPANTLVKRAVIAQLKRSEGVDELEFEMLCRDLDANQFAIRQKAAGEIAKNYLVYAELINQKLNEEKHSSEVRKRLETIKELNNNTKPAQATIDVFDLTNDADYLITLLEEKEQTESRNTNQILFKRLNLLSGKAYQSVDAWKSWSANNKK